MDQILEQTSILDFVNKKGKSLFHVCTDIKIEHFLMILENKKSQDLLILKDSANQSPLENLEDNDISIFLFDLSPKEHDIYNRFFKVVSNYEKEENKKEIIEKVMIKLLVENSVRKGTGKIECFMESLGNHQLNEIKLDWRNISKNICEMNSNCFSLTQYNILKKHYSHEENFNTEVIVYSKHQEVLQDVMFNFDYDNNKIQEIIHRINDNINNDFFDGDIQRRVNIIKDLFSLKLEKEELNNILGEERNQEKTPPKNKRI